MADVRVFVGCCGFPFSRRKYYAMFATVEVQQTFYKLPQKDTVERWRGEAPSEFVFNMKAWQVITHPSSSPTWKRAGMRPPGNVENYGYLKPTSENIEAWCKSVEIARILSARVVVLQTPPSFGYSGENEQNAREFFSIATKFIDDNMVIGWEPRGNWSDYQDVVEDIVCSIPRVIHIVDPFRRNPVICSGQRILYLRLHGIGGREVNYKYRYSDDDLAKLVNLVRSIIEQYDSIREVYVMFNNVYMGNDARRFKEIAGRRGLNVV